MAQISELKKVEQLEAAVLANDIPAVLALFEKYGSFEFTARALGIACHYSGAAMVEALLDQGASFRYEMTANFKRKYNCGRFINNETDEAERYVCYLFPGEWLQDHEDVRLPDEEKKKILSLIIDRELWDLQELLYYAILYNDEVCITTLRAAGIQRLSDYWKGIASGQVPHNQLSSIGRAHRTSFCNYARSGSPEEIITRMQNFLQAMEMEKLTFSKSFYYGYDFAADKEISAADHCSEKLFPFLAEHTNLLEQVPRRELLLGMIDANNATGMHDLLEKGYAKDGTDFERLMKYIRKKPGTSPELVAYVLEKKRELLGDEPEPVVAPLGKGPTLAEMKKIWGFKKQPDGTLIITSYKGEETYVVIPERIGKDMVTAIHSDAFSTTAPRVTPEQEESRAALISVEFPGTIQHIPERMFFDGYGKVGHKALQEVIFHEGTVSIGDYAFRDCVNLVSVQLPETLTTIGASAFDTCVNLQKLDIPGSVSKLKGGAFTNCGFEEFTIPDTVAMTGGYHFGNCRRLHTLVLAEGMERVPNGLCSNCVSLQNITLPDTVKEIGANAFNGCVQLRTITPLKDVILGEGAFDGCELLSAQGGIPQ